MSKLGVFKGKEVHDYPSGAAADEASQLFDIFAVYWIGESEGVMLWKGQDVGYVKMHKNGEVTIEDFYMDVFQSKRKETPAAPAYVKETTWEESKETSSASVPAEAMYDKNWYEKIMGELKNQWESMRPEGLK